MSRFQIIEAKAHHCGAIVRRMRTEHRDAIMLLGISSHHQLRASFDDSTFRHAWLLDGKLAALGGVTGSALSPSGQIWLAMTNEAASYPIAAAREIRRYLAMAMMGRHEVYTSLLPEDKTALVCH